jgi:hypothetical protein
MFVKGMEKSVFRFIPLTIIPLTFLIDKTGGGALQFQHARSCSRASSSPLQTEASIPPALPNCIGGLVCHGPALFDPQHADQTGFTAPGGSSRFR